jgi:serine/threonine protein kinase
MNEALPSQDQLLEQLRKATLGQYDIAGEVGHGGMATVYLAHDLSLDRKVAIKVMSPALVLGPGMVERFKREARTAANLSHPNIIPIYAVKEAEGLLFFVMKLVEGTQLDSVMHELGMLPVAMVEAILAQVGGAFGYAHRRGVIHRDIKPSNILIDEEGWAIVTDFGIAKVNDTEGLTVTGGTVGTPTYMSPEQCNGGEITGASDQYSLGVVAYEMLAGRPPFTGGSMMALMYSHFHDAPPPLEAVRPDCPPRLRNVITRMLSKEPKDRFPTMEEAVAAMGAQQLAHDDPTRTQLILLARTGSNNRVSKVQTPRSPIPLHRRRLDQEKPARRWLVPVAAAVVTLGFALGAYFLGLNRSAPPLPDSTVAVSPVPPPVQQTPDRSGPERERQARPATPPPAPAPQSQSRGAGTTVNPVTPPPPPPIASVPAAAPAPAPAPSPVPPPPPPPPSDRPSAETLASAKFIADSAAVTGAIMAYAHALEAGDLAAARRAFPALPDDQRQGLEAFWKAGGTMRTRWSISGITIDGDVAAARVSGSNLVSTPRQRDSEQPVALRARLERQSGVWKLTRLGS